MNIHKKDTLCKKYYRFFQIKKSISILHMKIERSTFSCSSKKLELEISYSCKSFKTRTIHKNLI